MSHLKLNKKCCECNVYCVVTPREDEQPVFQSYLQIDLCFIKGEAGAVVAVRVDVCQDNSEERGGFPVPGEPPTSRLAKLKRYQNISGVKMIVFTENLK